MSHGRNRNLTFFSAGMEVSVSKPLRTGVRLTAEKLRLDLGPHRRRQIDRRMMKCYDMILAMDSRQFQTLRYSFPQCEQKICVVPLFDSHRAGKDKGYGRYNIHDPFGRDIDDYENCFLRIRTCIEKIFERIELR
jgi:protein-tyrosine-phosphatase